MQARLYRRLIASVLLALATGAVLVLAYAFNFLSGLQAQSTDVLFKVRPPSALQQYAQRIALIAMDDRTIDRLGYWVSWDRSSYTRLVRFLTEAKARVIAFDVSFEQPKTGDEELAKAIAEAGMVVQPVAGSPNLPQVTRAGEVVRFKGLVSPRPELAQVSALLGHANVLTDGDGAVRTTPLLIRVGDQEYPSLALAAASLYLRRPKPLDVPAATPHLRASGRTIPVDPFYRMIINYAGGPTTSTGSSAFQVASFLDVLEGRVDPAVFRDRIVFVGLLGATGFADDYWVPTAEAGTGKMAGVEIHANAAATILSNSFLVAQDQVSTAATILIMALACAVVAAVFSTVLAAVFALGLAGIFMLFAFAMFDRGLIMNVIYPQLSLVVTFIVVTVYRVVFEEAQQRATLKAMGQYLSPVVMQEVMKDPESLRLGGQKREMTVLFSDIRGFTSFAEKLDPEQLVNLLNDYLTAMTDVVFKHEGVLDKYMGDAVMAFWGAPIVQPEHAVHACDTALGMTKALGPLHARFEEYGIPKLNIGIGLNSGPMSVGNMGSSKRFDYTVMGDAVNLASRLEGTNKEYGTNIVISQSTWDLVKQWGFVARFLDLVAVKGKKEPVAVHELLGRDGSVEPWWGEISAKWDGAVQAYRRADWDAAEREFEAVLEIRPDDGPARLYVERCRALRSEPPPAGWDGVYVMKTK